MNSRAFLEREKNIGGTLTRTLCSKSTDNSVSALGVTAVVVKMYQMVVMTAAIRRSAGVRLRMWYD